MPQGTLRHPSTLAKGTSCQHIADTSVPAPKTESASAPFRNDRSGNKSGRRASLPLISGLLVGLIGLAFVIGGVAGWFTVNSELVDEQVTVADDAERFAGEQVDGPLSAYYLADIVKQRVLDSTDGKTYAELGQDDPAREVALQGSTVRSALMTSVTSFGVSALAFGAGVAAVIAGVGLASRRTS